MVRKPFQGCSSVSAPDTSVYPAQHMSIYRLPPNEIAHAGGGH